MGEIVVSKQISNFIEYIRSLICNIRNVRFAYNNRIANMLLQKRSILNNVKPFSFNILFPLLHMFVCVYLTYVCVCVTSENLCIRWIDFISDRKVGPCVKRQINGKIKQKGNY